MSVSCQPDRNVDSASGVDAAPDGGPDQRGDPGQRADRARPDAAPAALSQLTSEAGDEELLAAIADSDRAAFADVYDRFADRVFGIVDEVVRDEAAAAAITRDTFVDVWRDPDRLGSARGSHATRLLALAHRRAVEHMRSHDIDHDRYVGLRRSPAPREDATAGAGAVHPVREAMNRLPALQRGIIELAYFGGETCRDVAETLGTPVETVRTQLRAAMRQLRDDLGVYP